MLRDLPGKDINTDFIQRSDDPCVAEESVDIVVVACGRGPSLVAALGRGVVEEDEFLDEGADRFEHQDAHGKRLRRSPRADRCSRRVRQ